jgi:hypothetical protein
MENPDWRLRVVYVLQDPRARLADIKLRGKYVGPTGRPPNPEATPPPPMGWQVLLRALATWPYS